MGYGALDRAMALSDRARASNAMMDKDKEKDMPKTLGGGLMAAGGGAAAGGATGAAIGGATSGSTYGLYGAAAGAVIGLAAYYLS